MGTNNLIRETILKNKVNDFKIYSVSCPEFLREGRAVKDFLSPDRIIIGSDSEIGRQMIYDLFKPLERQSSPILVYDSLETAEMIKYASNAFLTTKISYINELSRLAETFNIDIKNVAQGMGLDNRIGARFLQAGIGFGGSCFSKDVFALFKMGLQKGVELSIVKDALIANDLQVDWFLDKITSNINQNNKIGVLGLSFKQNTDDIRESRSILLINKLGDCVTNGPRDYKNLLGVMII